MKIVIEHGCKIDVSARIGTKPFALRKRGLSRVSVRKEARGGVWVKEFVSVGAFVSIQNGVTRPTTIGPYTFLNDGARIGHDVDIGRNCHIGLNTTVSGYTEIGDDVDIGPGCTVSNRVKIGKGARVRIGSLVLDDIPPGADYAGRPAVPFGEFKRRRARMKELILDEDSA